MSTETRDKADHAPWCPECGPTCPLHGTDDRPHDCDGWDSCPNPAHHATTAAPEGLSDAEWDDLRSENMYDTEEGVRRFVDRIIAARESVAATRARAEALRETADEMWRIFLRLPHTPSPLGDYLQRRVNDLRARADSLAPDTAGESA